jgi:hypothetical protein
MTSVAAVTMTALSLKNVHLARQEVESAFRSLEADQSVIEALGPLVGAYAQHRAASLRNLELARHGGDIAPGPRVANSLKESARESRDGGVGDAVQRASSESGIPALESCTVLDEGNLASGYDLGVDTNQRSRRWLHATSSELRMAYPPGQQWGAVFAVVGRIQQSIGARRTRDFSAFHTLAVSMRGARGGEIVEIGLKDKTDSDDGSETRIRQKLTREYKTYTFPLGDFRTANLQELYVVTEFVFGGPEPSTIFVNRIEFR